MFLLKHQTKPIAMHGPYLVFNMDKIFFSLLTKCSFQKIKKKVYFSNSKLFIEYFTNYPKHLTI